MVNTPRKAERKNLANGNWLSRIVKSLTTFNKPNLFVDKPWGTTILDRPKVPKANTLTDDVNPLQMTQGIKTIPWNIQSILYDLHFYYTRRLCIDLGVRVLTLQVHSHTTVLKIIATNSKFHYTSKFDYKIWHN